MATAVQSSSTQPSPPGNDTSSTPLSWEGDKMFNIYIYDYCTKRGYRNTARELQLEADLGRDTIPPINARQGLLYEWWSVFWVLFSAKANSGGSDDAHIYMQHYLQRQNQRIPPNQAIPMSQQAGQQPMLPQQPPMNRLPNGVQRPGPHSFNPNGPLTNGTGPQAGMNPFTIAGGPQPNGIPGQPGGGPHPPGSMPPGQPQNAGYLIPNAQRPIGAGMPPQPNQQTPGQRNPNAPFPSPTMANSPQNPSGSQGGQQQNPQPQQPPMGQLSGPSPHMGHMRGGMLPMGQGMNPMNPQQQGPPGHQGQQTGGGPVPNQFPQPGQTPSRSGTPGQAGPSVGGPGGNMMHPTPSPSLAPRAVSMPGGQGAQVSLQDLNAAYSSIPAMIAQQIQKELNMDGKDINTLTPTEKSRIVGLYRGRHPPSGNPTNGQRGQGQRNNQPQQPVPLQQRGKRSPGEDEMLPRTDTSPPDRKRQRRSPMEPNTGTNPQQMVSSYPMPQQPPQQGGQPSMMGSMMMPGRPGPPMPMLGMGGQQGQHPGQPQGMGPGPMGMGGMGIGPGGGPQPGMVNSMGQPMGPPNMNSHMQNQANPGQFRMMNKPGGPGPPGMVGNPQSPAGDPTMFGMGGPGFNQPGRMPPNKMMPNPPPGMGVKDPNVQGGPPGGPGGPSSAGLNPGPKGSIAMESPRNAPNSNPQGLNPPNASSTPSASNQSGPMGTGQNIAPSPSTSMLGGGPSGLNPGAGPMGAPPPPGSSQGPGGLGGDLFSTDFINSVASSLDEFDSSLFRPDGDINFERDFGQWFNPDDVSGSLETN